MTKTISACASAFYDLMAPSVTSKESFFAYVLGETAKLPYFDRSQCPDNDKLADFGTAIFRTYDDDGGVITAAVIREFLRLKWYGALVTVICRSLLNCNYGKHRYLGTKYDYAVEERYFDRFIEMSRFFEIGEAAIFPMLVHAQAYENADPSAAWARPASEYIYGACERGVAPTLEAVMRCSDCGGALERLCVYNEITVIESACYALLFMADVNKRELRRFLSAHKRIALKYVMQYFDDANAGVRETVIRVMLMFKQDETVRARLLTAYETETSLKLRRLINAECAITLRVDGIRSAEELDKAAHESKVRGASRKITLNLRYTDGKKMPRAACSYILGMFNSKSAMPAEKVALISVKGLLDPASLSRQCADFVALDGIGKYPAAAAFVFLFGEDDDAHELLLKLDISSQKPARRKLLLNLIGISGLTVCRKYLNLLRLDRRLKNAAMSALMLSCEVWGRSVMDVEEEFADDFGLDGEGNYVYNGDSAARLDDELNVVLYGKPNIRLTAWSKRLLKAIAEHSARFERSFLSDRRWENDVFERNVVNNKLLVRIAETLFFGEYDGTRLAGIFVIDKGHMRRASAVGEAIKLADGRTVGLVHPIELDAGSADLKTITSRQAFIQMKREVYTVKDAEIAHNCISRFKGSILPSEQFVEHLKARGYVRAEGKNAAYKIIGDVMSELDFSELTIQGHNSISVNEVRFYSVINTPKIKSLYITDKSYAISLRTLPARFLSDAIYDMTKIVKL